VLLAALLVVSAMHAVPAEADRLTDWLNGTNPRGAVPTFPVAPDRQRMSAEHGDNGGHYPPAHPDPVPAYSVSTAADRIIKIKNKIKSEPEFLRQLAAGPTDPSRRSRPPTAPLAPLGGSHGHSPPPPAFPQSTRNNFVHAQKSEKELETPNGRRRRRTAPPGNQSPSPPPPCPHPPHQPRENSARFWRDSLELP